MKKHGLWMLIGCVLPILLIFLFPLLGIRGEWTLFVFVILMFGCHLFMTGGHKKVSGKGADEEEHHGHH